MSITPDSIPPSSLVKNNFTSTDNIIKYRVLYEFNSSKRTTSYKLSLTRSQKSAIRSPWHISSNSSSTPSIDSFGTLVAQAVSLLLILSPKAARSLPAVFASLLLSPLPSAISCC